MIDHLLALPEGYTLQEYTILGTLGFGGFGITYKALDNYLDKVVAIKEYLPSELAVRLDGSTVSARSDQDREGFEWGRERFLAEARTVARFDHPNIIRIYRFFEQNGTGYIVMEYVEGRPLSRVLEQLGTLDETQIRAWLWPILEGLKVVHQENFLHRDIKPQNIMIGNEGTPVLLDFGAARVAVSGHTRSLTSILTPGFAPLEQYQTKGNQGAWTDIYALGAVIYCCMAGKKPRNPLDRVTEDRLEPPDFRSQKQYSRGLVNGVMAALSLREGDRPQDIDQWMAILNDEGEAQTRVMQPTPVDSGIEPEPDSRTQALPGPRETEKTPDRSRPGKWVFVALLLLLFLATGGYWLLQNPPESQHVRSETDLNASDHQQAPIPRTATQESRFEEPEDPVAVEVPAKEEPTSEVLPPKYALTIEPDPPDEITRQAENTPRQGEATPRPVESAPSLVIITGCDDKSPLESITPQYPQEALSRGVEGLVTLEFTVDVEGQVVGPKIKAAEPPGVFDNAALEAIRQFRYRPNTFGGQIHPCLGAQELRFQIEDGRG